MLGTSMAYMIMALLLMVVSLINRDYLPAGMDYLCFLLIGVLSVRTMIGNRNFFYPRYYISLLSVFVAVILFNSFSSPYSPGFVYIAVASLVTVMPFLTFLLSYNVRFTEEEISSFIDKTIIMTCALAALIYAENVLFRPEKVDSIIASDIFMYGFWASFSSLAVVLALARYHVTKRKRYLYAIGFLFITVILMNQLKAVAGVGIAVIAYLFFMSKMHKVLKVGVLSFGAAAFGVWIAVSGSFMIEKATKYTEYLTDEEAGEGIARVVLYVKSVEMARDFFPLGTGQGTFGSIPVNMIYSDVYHDYELSDIWGLGEDDEVNFIMDTHWSSVLGEAGVLGLLLYIMLMIYPAVAVITLVRRKENMDETDRSYLFLVVCGTVILMAESFVLALPNRFCFILLYAGLNALIVRNMYTSENLLDYEDSPDND